MSELLDVKKRRIVLGFGCKRRRGKDTAARLACIALRDRGICARLDAFAEPLKQAVTAIFSLSSEQLYGDLKTVNDPFWEMTPREILQRFGTEAVRDGFGHDIWCRSLVRRAQQLPEMSVVVSDVRFPNEVDAIKGLGGFTVRVDRDVPPDSAQDDHPSETALNHYTGWDFSIDNNGTLEVLEAEVSLIIRSIID